MSLIAARRAVADRPPVDFGRLARVLATAACVAAVAGAAWQFVVLPLLGRFPGEFEDFAAYVQGVTALAHGQSPYASFDGSSIVMSGFIYPPFAAILMRPLTLLGTQWQSILWLWVSLAALAGGAVIVARELLPASWPRTRMGLLLALTFPPATYNLWHGQVNTIIFLLLALALREWMRGRLTRFAVIVGLTAGIKLVPVVLLLLLLRRVHWRALAAGAAATGATVLIGAVALGPSVTRQFVTTIFPVLSRDNGWIDNESWNGAANRLFAHSVVTPQAPLLVTHALTVVLSLATIGLVALVARRPAVTGAERGAQLGVAVCAMVLVGSINWFPVGVHLLIPVAAAVALAAERRRHLGSLWTVVTLLVACLFAVGIALFGALDPASVDAVIGGPGGWLFLQLASLPVLLTAALMVVLARAQRPSTDAPTHASAAHLRVADCAR